MGPFGNSYCIIRLISARKNWRTGSFDLSKDIRLLQQSTGFSFRLRVVSMEGMTRRRLMGSILLALMAAGWALAASTVGSKVIGMLLQLNGPPVPASSARIS